MILVEAMFYDIRDFVTIIWTTLVLGVRYLIKNWTREDTIAISKVSFGTLVGYVTLISVLLIWE